jgi:hypothetical protein
MLTAAGLRNQGWGTRRVRGTVVALAFIAADGYAQTGAAPQPLGIGSLL